MTLGHRMGWNGERQRSAPLRAVCLVLFLLIIVGAVTTAWADGKMFQRRKILKSPVTPDQRALLVFDAARGVETLVIETTVMGEGDQFAWVVPVPAVPEISASTTGLFPSLAFMSERDVIARFEPEWIVHLIFAVGIFGSVRWWRRPLRPIAALSLPPLTLLLGTLALCAAAPPGCSAKDKSGGSGGDHVRVIARSSVGVFDTTTLTATDAPALRAWLTENGFAAPESMDGVVTDLIREGWVFVASKVRGNADANAAQRVHPLAFTFQTKEAVYPMRLTGVGADSLAVELYVCGSRRAEADGFSTEFCDTARGGVGGGNSDGTFHDELRRRMGGAAVLTKLVGRLDGAAMARDVAFRWTRFKPHRGSWYLPAAAFQVAAAFGSLAFGLVLIGAAIASRWSAACAARAFTAFDLKSLAYAVAAASVVGVAVFSSLPRLPETDVATVEADGAQSLRDRLSAPPDEVRGDIDAVRRWATQATVGMRNDVTGEPVREEDSPGNWWIRDRDGDLTIVLWDSAHPPYVHEFTIDVSPR